MEVKVSWKDDAGHWDKLEFHWVLAERQKMSLLFSQSRRFTLLLQKQSVFFHVRRDDLFRDTDPEITPGRMQALEAILAAALQRISTPIARASLYYQTAGRTTRPLAQEVFLRYMNRSSREPA